MTANTHGTPVTIDGEWIYASESIAYHAALEDRREMLHSQTHLAFRNIQQSLLDAGSSLDDVIKVKYYVDDFSDFPALLSICEQYIGKARSATTILCPLGNQHKGMQIEVIAHLPVPQKSS